MSHFARNPDNTQKKNYFFLLPVNFITFFLRALWALSQGGGGKLMDGQAWLPIHFLILVSVSEQPRVKTHSQISDIQTQLVGLGSLTRVKPQFYGG